MPTSLPFLYQFLTISGHHDSSACLEHPSEADSCEKWTAFQHDQHTANGMNISELPDFELFEGDENYRSLHFQMQATAADGVVELRLRKRKFIKKD